MIKTRGRFSVVLLLSCPSLFGCGCGFGSIADYPESYTAPEFDEYRLTTDAFPAWWQCSFERAGTICEAAITRDDNGEYVVKLAVSSNDQFSYDDLSPGVLAGLAQQENDLFNLTDLPSRVLTEQQVDRMKALFSDLRINRNPSPFSLVCCLGIRLLRVHAWDGVELGTHTRDGAMIDFSDSGVIVAFLGELVPPNRLAR